MAVVRLHICCLPLGWNKKDSYSLLVYLNEKDQETNPNREFKLKFELPLKKVENYFQTPQPVVIDLESIKKPQNLYARLEVSNDETDDMGFIETSLARIVSNGESILHDEITGDKMSGSISIQLLNYQDNHIKQLQAKAKSIAELVVKTTNDPSSPQKPLLLSDNEEDEEDEEEEEEEEEVDEVVDNSILTECKMELKLSCKDVTINQPHIPNLKIVVYQNVNESSWKEVSRTETVYNERSPTFTKTIAIIYKYHERLQLCFALFDSVDVIGFYETSLTSMVNHSQVSASFGHAYENQDGMLFINVKENKDEILANINANRKIKIDSPPKSIVDYKKGGLLLNLKLWIDFSASNGHQSSPVSLHFIGEKTFNPYKKFLQSLETFLKEDEQVFCTLLAPFSCQHVGYEEKDRGCYELNSNSNLVEKYETYLSEFRFTEPTNIAPIFGTEIDSFVKNVESGVAPDKNKFTTVLILTDGKFTDAYKAKAELAKLETFPLFFVVVNVMARNENFKTIMETIFDESNVSLLVMEDFTDQNNFFKTLLETISKKMIQHLETQSIDPMENSNTDSTTQQQPKHIVSKLKKKAQHSESLPTIRNPSESQLIPRSTSSTASSQTFYTPRNLGPTQQHNSGGGKSPILPSALGKHAYYPPEKVVSPKSPLSPLIGGKLNTQSAESIYDMSRGQSPDAHPHHHHHLTQQQQQQSASLASFLGIDIPKDITTTTTTTNTTSQGSTTATSSTTGSSAIIGKKSKQRNRINSVSSVKSDDSSSEPSPPWSPIQSFLNLDAGSLSSRLKDTKSVSSRHKLIDDDEVEKTSPSSSSPSSASEVVQGTESSSSSPLPKKFEKVKLELGISLVCASEKEALKKSTNLVGSSNALDNTNLLSSYVICYSKLITMTKVKKVGKSQGSSSGGEEWVEIGRTNIVSNNNSPQYETTIKIEQIVGQEQLLKFEVKDAQKAPLAEPLCSLVTKVEDIVCQNKFTSVRKFSNGFGTIKIIAEEDFESNLVARFRFNGRKLEKQSIMAKPKAFYTISKLQTDGTYTLIYKSPYSGNRTCDPIWPPANIKVSKLCGRDFKRLLMIQVFDFNKSNSIKLIGRFKTSFLALISCIGDEMEIFNDLKRDEESKNYYNSGYFGIEDINITECPTLADFISDGLLITCSMAIDFSSSNGSNLNSKALHRLYPNSMNQYQLAQTTISNTILSLFQPWKHYIYGFGGILLDGSPSDVFELSPDNDVNFSSQEVLKAYHSALESITPTEPTKINPLIQIVKDRIKQKKDFYQQHQQQPLLTFEILFIFTDGIIEDLQKTLETSITTCKNIPLSIIIIGLGGGGGGGGGQSTSSTTDPAFTKVIKQVNEYTGQVFQSLDDDHNSNNSGSGGYNKKHVVRNVVQFLDFNDMKVVVDKLVYDIPEEIVNYFSQLGIEPVTNREYRSRYRTTDDLVGEISTFDDDIEFTHEK